MHEQRIRLGFLILLSLLLPVIFLPGCIFRKLTEAERYAAWAIQRSEEITAYQAFLDENAVGDIVPMSQLLKSARDWKKCRVEAFTMPPKELWPNIVPTLQVVKKFKAEGILINPVAASVYRDPVLNVCAGGSLKSKHLQLNAIDFNIEVTPDSLETLCNAWRVSGPELKLGLGFYSPSRIHLDTLGHRGWGSDQTHKSSLCLLAEPELESKAQP